MEKEEYLFNPDEELLALAEDFSNNYKILSSGHYASNNTKYSIEYSDKIIDKNTGKEKETDGRITEKSGIIELSRSKLKSDRYTSDYVFYLIIMLVILRDVKDNYKADIIAIKYYTTQTNRSVKNLTSGILHLFSNVNNGINIKRYKEIDKFIKNFKKDNK